MGLSERESEGESEGESARRATDEIYGLALSISLYHIDSLTLSFFGGAELQIESKIAGENNTDQWSTIEEGKRLGVK